MNHLSIRKTIIQKRNEDSMISNFIKTIKIAYIIKLCVAYLTLLKDAYYRIYQILFNSKKGNINPMH